MDKDTRIETGRLFEASDFLLQFTGLHAKTGGKGRAPIASESKPVPFTSAELACAADFLRRLGLPVPNGYRMAGK